jgi:hypothetical protein
MKKHLTPAYTWKKKITDQYPAVDSMKKEIFRFSTVFNSCDLEQALEIEAECRDFTSFLQEQKFDLHLPLFLEKIFQTLKKNLQILNNRTNYLQNRRMNKHNQAQLVLLAIKSFLTDPDYQTGVTEENLYQELKYNDLDILQIRNLLKALNSPGEILQPKMDGKFIIPGFNPDKVSEYSPPMFSHQFFMVDISSIQSST